MPGNEVRVAGVKVGKVTKVKLNGDKVRVTFKVKDAWVGDRTTAMIRIKTLLGQKFVALDPQGTQPLSPGDPIPKERTLAPYDVNEAFNGLDPASALQVKHHLQHRLTNGRCAVLLATHSLDIVEHYADKAALLIDGRIVREWSEVEIAAFSVQGDNAMETALAQATS